jgi:hypothetical protein
LTITTVPDSGQVVGDWQITSDGKDGFGSGEGTFSGRFRFETSGVRKWKFSGSWTDKDGKTSTYFKGETESPEFKIFEVKITSADVTQDKIHIELKPDGLSGTLKLELVGPSTTHTIREVVRNSGSYDETFDIDKLKEGEYTQVRASWKINNQTASDVFDYHIKVLGKYMHTRYNTPNNESPLCRGISMVPFCYTSGDCINVNCNVVNRDGRGKGTWIKEVKQNGNGYISAVGYVSIEYFCPRPRRCPNFFRNVPTVCVSCRGESAIANQTVAIKESHKDLKCGDEIYVHNVGLVRVTDYSKAKNFKEDQLDHYAGVSGCNEPVSIGKQMTIKLFK